MSKGTKLCKYCQSEIPKKATVCPVCKKNLGGIGCFTAIAIIFIVFGFFAVISDNASKNKNSVTKTGTIDGAVSSSSDSESVSNRFNVGDIVETSDLRISYISAGVYYSDNQYINPKDGYEFYRFEFKVENISDSDQYISEILNWECYADNSNVGYCDWSFDDDLDATISSGREVQGALYYEVPVDSQSIELEYDINYWGNDKIIFIGK